MHQQVRDAGGSATEGRRGLITLSLITLSPGITLSLSPGRQAAPSRCLRSPPTAHSCGLAALPSSSSIASSGYQRAAMAMCAGPRCCVSSRKRGGGSPLVRWLPPSRAW